MSQSVPDIKITVQKHILESWKTSIQFWGINDWSSRWSCWLTSSVLKSKVRFCASRRIRLIIKLNASYLKEVWLVLKEQGIHWIHVIIGENKGWNVTLEDSKVFCPPLQVFDSLFCFEFCCFYIQTKFSVNFPRGKNFSILKLNFQWIS